MRRRRLTPAQFLAISFAAIIAVGTILLKLPTASESGMSLSWIDAFFTATSAVCVTGLIVVDTPRQFSVFGEIIVVLLIQLGGLGYMTISTVLWKFMGRKPTLEERAALQESLSLDGREGLVRFAGTVAVYTLAIEFVGALILTLHWWSSLGFWKSASFGSFHAVSAFNNAGFSLFSDNLLGFRGDIVVNAIISTLIVLGGLGFLVLQELVSWLRTRRRRASRPPLSVHARLVLVATAALILGGTVAIRWLESANPRTIGQLPEHEAWLAAYFQSISARTAGFNSIDIGAMRPVTLFAVMALMFIGASPGGTGGGIKTTTFGVTVAALWATVQGARDVVLFRRRLPPEVISRAFFVSLIAFLAVNVVGGLILVVERRDFLSTLFEATSAFGTVGLSMGQTGSVLSASAFFSTWGKLLIAAMMFMGRVGPLTLAVAVVGRTSSAHIRYPEARVSIG